MLDLTKKIEKIIINRQIKKAKKELKISNGVVMEHLYTLWQQQGIINSIHIAKSKFKKKIEFVNGETVDVIM